jgi:peroxiredoxin
MMAVKTRGWRQSLPLYLAVVLLTLPPAFAVRGAIKKARAERVAEEAKAFVRREKGQPLSEPLRQLLADTAFTPQPTQEHPLLGRAVPDFGLGDDRGQTVSLGRLRREGPVVLVFYYGYSCSHCVAQLFGVDEDRRLFEELGARLVAVSADPPELTAEQCAANGHFGFPVLSDPDNRVAEAFGVYRRAAEGQPARLLHATFLIDTDGRLLWAYRGPQPFLDNKTLLKEVARGAGHGGPAPQPPSPPNP